MDSTQRKGINFDLDTEALQQHYPKGDWHNAYYDVRAYFEKNGFEVTYLPVDKNGLVDICLLFIK